MIKDGQARRLRSLPSSGAPKIPRICALLPFVPPVTLRLRITTQECMCPTIGRYYSSVPAVGKRRIANLSIVSLCSLEEYHLTVLIVWNSTTFVGWLWFHAAR